MTPEAPKFPIACPDADEYNGKWALMRSDKDGQMEEWIGRLFVHRTAGYLWIDAHARNSKSTPDNTNVWWCFHLSQAHVDSIVTTEKSEAEFEIKLPFLVRDSRPDRPARQAEIH